MAFVPFGASRSESDFKIHAIGWAKMRKNAFSILQTSALPLGYRALPQSAFNQILKAPVLTMSDPLPLSRQRFERFCPGPAGAARTLVLHQMVEILGRKNEPRVLRVGKTG
jgi:hypothetical protein